MLRCWMLAACMPMQKTRLDGAEMVERVAVFMDSQEDVIMVYFCRRYGCINPKVALWLMANEGGLSL